MASGVNEVKKLAKEDFLRNLEEMLKENGYEYGDGADYNIKGTALVVKGVQTDKGTCDLKIMITAPAKGTEY